MFRTMIKNIFLILFIGFSINSSAEVFISDGAEIFYTDEGRGDVVILIHGFVSSADSTFRNPGATEQLSADFRVISIDNRGHGKSSKSHDPGDYGFKMVQDVINLMDHLNIEKANIVGYSMGGMITNKLMVSFPERVEKAVSGGFGYGGENGGDTSRLIADALESGKGLEPLLIMLTPKGEAPPSAEAIAATNERVMVVNDPLALAAAARGFPQLSNIRESQMRANQVPILYIVGELDPLIADVDRARELVSNASFAVIPGTNHVTTISHPDFVSIIRNFLLEY